MPSLIGLSIIIPTRNREKVLIRTLSSLGEQDHQPEEVIIVDASDEYMANKFNHVDGLMSRMIHLKADVPGAAQQRNQGVAIASHPIIGFIDDDILLEPHCIKLLWETINDPKVGGCNAMIINQKFQQPGKISMCFYSLFIDSKSSLAGRCIGPAINFLPADSDELHWRNQVDWLNTTCAFYKKEYMDSPPFGSHFTGYSFMEDLTLSLSVAKKANLYNVRTARIFHDSQPGSHKQNVVELSEMDLVNRFYVMRRVLNASLFTITWQLFFQQTFSIISNLKSLKAVIKLPAVTLGKIKGVWKILGI